MNAHPRIQICSNRKEYLLAYMLNPIKVVFLLTDIQEMRSRQGTCFSRMFYTANG